MTKGIAVGMAAALAALGAGPAGAQVTAPCGAVPIHDARGDQEVGLIVDPTHVVPRTKGPDNLDVTHAFLNTTMGGDGKWNTSVNIGIAHLTRAVPPESSTRAVTYALEFNRHSGENIVYVSARSDGTNVIYRWASGVTIAAPGYPIDLTMSAQPTTGRFVEGPDGMVSIDLPDAISAPGTMLEDAYVIVSQRDAGFYAPFAEVGYRFDAAPDDEMRAGLDIELEACQEPAAPAASSPTPIAGPPPPAELPVRVRAALGSARRAMKSRSLAVKLTASQPVSRLSAKLRDRRGMALAGARVPRLRGTRTIKLKPYRRLTKGDHTIALEGTVHGRRQTVEYAVTLKR